MKNKDYHLLPAIDATEEVLRDLKEGKRSVKTVFNSFADSQRFYGSKDKSDPDIQRTLREGRKQIDVKQNMLPMRLRAFIRELKTIFQNLSPNFKIKNYSLIESTPDTTEQQFHIDYAILQSMWPPFYLPLVGILALEENVCLLKKDLMDDEESVISIPKGSCLIFRGNMYHAGAGWNRCQGARFHFYIETTGFLSDPKSNGFIESISKPIRINCQHPEWYCYLILCYETENLRKFILESASSHKTSVIVNFMTQQMVRFNSEEDEPINVLIPEEIIPYQYYEMGLDLFLYLTHHWFSVTFTSNQPTLTVPTFTQIRYHPKIKIMDEIEKCNFPALFQLNLRVTNSPRVCLPFEIDDNMNYYETYLIITSTCSGYMIYSKDFTYRNHWIIRRSGSAEMTRQEINSMRNIFGDFRCIFYRYIF